MVSASNTLASAPTVATSSGPDPAKTDLAVGSATRGCCALATAWRAASTPVFSWRLSCRDPNIGCLGIARNYSG
jgi:hypothetical protein